MGSHAELVQHIPKDNHAPQVTEIRPAVVQTKVLGIQWDVTSDEFFHVSKHSDYKGEVTKRRMLSQLSYMYDPLGLLAPLLHKSKNAFPRDHENEDTMG